MRTEGRGHRLAPALARRLEPLAGLGGGGGGGEGAGGRSGRSFHQDMLFLCLFCLLVCLWDGGERLRLEMKVFCADACADADEMRWARCQREGGYIYISFA